MHIPDAYLSPLTQGVAFAAMVPVWYYCAKRTARDLTSKQAPLLSIGAAFCFAVQMFNIPALGGTTAHALGATLLAVLVGPYAAVIGMTLTLVIQALLFGDGGILSIGANCWDMALIAPAVGYSMYRVLSASSPEGSTRPLIAAAVGSYTGTVAASLSAGVLLGIQPLIAHDSAGHALYCPFGLNIAVPAMGLTHLLVAAPAEAIITVAALAYLWKTFPELRLAGVRTRVGTGARLYRRLAWLLLLTPLGLLAGGDAFGEWDVEKLEKMVGYVPAGAAKAHELVHPLLPDYGFAGVQSGGWQVLGYLASALIGCAVVAGFTRTIVHALRVEAATEVPITGTLGRDLPAWMHAANPPLPPAQALKSPWLENTVLKMRSAIAKTVASETIARQPGLLQSIHPLAKTLGFVCALMATAFAHSPLVLAAMIGLVAAGAFVSAVPMKSTFLRVFGSVIFFGSAVALPVAFQGMTPGPVALQLGPIALSTPGLHAAMMILLRLAAGISLAILWNLTTRWNDLLKSLRWLGAPPFLITTATLTYRYIFVMMETLGDMVDARKSRQVGACDKRQARTYAGNATGVLFAKSLAFTEELQMAMQSRGAGSPAKPSSMRNWRGVDSIAVAAGAVLLMLVVWQGMSHAG